MTDDSIYRFDPPPPQTEKRARAVEETHSSHHAGVWMMALCLLMVGAVLFAVLNHPPVHWTSLWPLLLVLLCPLLHFLMHRGHSGH